MMTKPQTFVDVHRAVLRGLQKLALRAPVVKLSRLAREVGRDPRVVRLHLEVAQLHDEGLFVDKEKSMFAVKEPLERLVRSVAAGNPALEASYEAADLMFEEKGARVVQAR